MKRYAVLRVKNDTRKTRGFGPGTRELDGSGAKISIESMAEVEVAEATKDPLIRAVAPVMPTRLIQPLAADELAYEGNWGIAATGATDSTCSGEGVVVAVLDTGIDASHVAFAGVDLVQKDFSGSGDGDRQGHGTHCAGTIFGRNIGTTKRIGIARGVRRALIGKVLSDNGGGDSQWLFDGMLWAMRSGANVISMSLGFDFPGMVENLIDQGWPPALATSVALEAYRGNLRMFDAVMSLMNAQAAFGLAPVVVAAAGNESRREQDSSFRIAASLPAAANNVISVAAVGRCGELLDVAPFSNTMATVAAPGVEIVSARAGGGLQTLSGTSMACPHVAGVAALWWEAVRRTGATPNTKNVTARIIATTRRNVFPPKIEEIDIGQGLVTAPE